MKLVPHEQGSELWLQWRQGGIGGSDAPVIMGVSPYQTRDELLNHKAAHPNRSKWGAKNRASKTEAQLRGTRLEPLARELYQARTGYVMLPACGIHDEYDWMRASFDGLRLPEADLVLEIKCVNWRFHQGALDGVVPTLYWPQVQHLLCVSGAPKLHYFSYSEHARFEGTPKALALVPVVPDRGYIEVLLAEEKRFQEDLNRLLEKS